MWPSLKSSLRDDSNEWSHHRFGWKIGKLEFWKLSILDLICCPATSKLILVTIPTYVPLKYLAHSCLGTRPFHVCQNVYPSDIDLRPKSVFEVSKIDHSSYTNWGTTFMFGTHMSLVKTFPYMPKFWPLDVRVHIKVSKSALMFRKLLWTPVPIEV